MNKTLYMATYILASYAAQEAQATYMLPKSPIQKSEAEQESQKEPLIPMLDLIAFDELSDIDEKTQLTQSIQLNHDVVVPIELNTTASDTSITQRQTPQIQNVQLQNIQLQNVQLQNMQYQQLEQLAQEQLYEKLIQNQQFKMLLKDHIAIKNGIINILEGKSFLEDNDYEEKDINTFFDSLTIKRCRMIEENININKIILLYKQRLNTKKNKPLYINKQQLEDFIHKIIIQFTTDHIINMCKFINNLSPKPKMLSQFIINHLPFLTRLYTDFSNPQFVKNFSIILLKINNSHKIRNFKQIS